MWVCPVGIFGVKTQESIYEVDPVSRATERVPGMVGPEGVAGWDLKLDFTEGQLRRMDTRRTSSLRQRVISAFLYWPFPETVHHLGDAITSARDGHSVASAHEGLKDQDQRRQDDALDSPQDMRKPCRLGCEWVVDHWPCGGSCELAKNHPCPHTCYAHLPPVDPALSAASGGRHGLAASSSGSPPPLIEATDSEHPTSSNSSLHSRREPSTAEPSTASVGDDSSDEAHSRGERRSS